MITLNELLIVMQKSYSDRLKWPDFRLLPQNLNSLS